MGTDPHVNIDIILCSTEDRLTVLRLLSQLDIFSHNNNSISHGGQTD